MKNKLVIPIEVNSKILFSNGRKLDPEWKYWSCDKCGTAFVYKGKRPSHKKCPGHFTIINMMSKESEEELIDCMAKEIKKEIKMKKKIKDECKRCGYLYPKEGNEYYKCHVAGTCPAFRRKEKRYES